MEEIGYPVMMQYLRGELKRRKVRIRELARILRVPESTLQKWFAAKDGPVGRINQVCAVLGITMADVLRELSRESTNEFVFNARQQELFKKDPETFVLFWRLVYERWPLEAIGQDLGLNSIRLQGALARLDRVGLIQLLPEGRIKLPRLRPIRWRISGEFISGQLRKWSQELLNDAFRTMNGSRVIVQYFQLSENSAKEFETDLLELEEKFARRTILEMRAGTRSLKGIRFLAASGASSFLRSRPRSTVDSKKP